jgi:mannan endo-1,4-beta-mannosidase
MVTDFDPNQKTAWGTLIITGVNGLQQTSKEASIYESTVPGGAPRSSIPCWLIWKCWAVADIHFEKE